MGTWGKYFLPAFGFCALAFLGLSGGVRAEENVRALSLTAKELIPVKIYRLMRDPTNLQPVVLLADIQEEKSLLIWIGPFEAEALNDEMQGLQHPRPFTHDLLETMIQKLNARVQRIVLTQVQESAYCASIILEKDGSSIEVDARPSDSLILALKSKAPIFISRKIFLERAVSIVEQKEVEKKYGLTLQPLTSMLAESFSYKSMAGVLVAAVQKDSQAEKDGLKRGDILVEIGGEAIPDLGALRRILARGKASLKARIFREGGFQTLPLHLP